VVNCSNERCRALEAMHPVLMILGLGLWALIPIAGLRNGQALAAFVGGLILVIAANL
jgi:hypothetical protein